MGNVGQYSPSVCGCYVGLKDLADGQYHKFTIELTIPFTGQLALQAWQLYPNTICGEIEEEVKTSLRDMVWRQVNPNVVKDTLERSNAGYVFNGADSGSNSITITFRDYPKYRGNDHTYYIPHVELPDVHPPAPEMWLCGDTYFGAFVALNIIHEVFLKDLNKQK